MDTRRLSPGGPWGPGGPGGPTMKLRTSGPAGRSRVSWGLGLGMERKGVKRPLPRSHGPEAGCEPQGTWRWRRSAGEEELGLSPHLAFGPPGSFKHQLPSPREEQGLGRGHLLVR